MCFHISISVIIHHQTLTGWKFYEERKHQPRAYYRFSPRESSIKRITRIEKVLQEATADIGGGPHGAHGDVWKGCEFKMTSKIERILDKFDSDSSDED